MDIKTKILIASTFGGVLVLAKASDMYVEAKKYSLETIRKNRSDGDKKVIADALKFINESEAIYKKEEKKFKEAIKKSKEYTELMEKEKEIEAEISQLNKDLAGCKESSFSLNVGDITIEGSMNEELNKLQDLKDEAVDRLNKNVDAIAALKKEEKAIIKADRTDGEKEIIAKAAEYNEKRNAIFAAERDASKGAKAMGNYLKHKGYTRNQVVFMASIPLIPVGYGVYRYYKFVESITDVYKGEK